MKKEQVNYRIDIGLLLSIKAAASRQGISYTQWITDACRDKLYPNKTSNESEANLYDKLYSNLSSVLYSKLYEGLYSILYSELVDTKTPKSFPNPTEGEDRNFIDRIKLDRELSKGLTNAQLARLLEKSPSTISRWSTGKRQPPDDFDWEFKPKLGKWYEKSND